MLNRNGGGLRFSSRTRPITSDGASARDVFQRRLEDGGGRHRHAGAVRGRAGDDRGVGVLGGREGPAAQHRQGGGHDHAAAAAGGSTSLMAAIPRRVDRCIVGTGATPRRRSRAPPERLRIRGRHLRQCRRGVAMRRARGTRWRRRTSRRSGSGASPASATARAELELASAPGSRRTRAPATSRAMPAAAAARAARSRRCRAPRLPATMVSTDVVSWISSSGTVESRRGRARPRRRTRPA